jgi:hypothetical protein
VSTYEKLAKVFILHIVTPLNVFKIVYIVSESTRNEKQESPSKFMILYLSWKDYFSFERSKKSFVSNSIPTNFCVFSCCLHCAFEEVQFKVWCLLSVYPNSYKHIF